MKLKKKIKRITIKDYKQAKKKIIEVAKKYNFLSIYEYGSCNNPGLSDIDLIIIIKNHKLKNKNNCVNFLKEIDQNNLEFFVGYSTIMFMDSSFFKNILIFDDLKVNKIFGKKIKLNNFKNLKKELIQLSIIDWLPERLLKLKINMKNIKKTNLRQHLGLLNSYKYTLKKVNNLLNYKEISKLINEIDILRKNSQNTKKLDKIKLITKICISKGFFILQELHKKKSLKNLSSNKIEDVALSFPNNSKIFFKNKINPKKNYMNSNSLFVPSIFSIHLLFYLQKKNNLSKILKNWVLTNQKKLIINNKNIKYILNKRSSLLSKNIIILKKNKLKKGLYKFGWFYG